MDGDVIEDRAKIGKGRKSVAKPHRPCLAHTVRTCSSVANSPRAAAAFEAVMAASSSGVSEAGGSSSAPLSRSTTRAMSSCASAEAARGRERLIEKFCHWWLGHKNFPYTICILSHILLREKLMFSPVGTSARRLSLV
ncbi:MAG: hypothetical protein WA709_36155, partial [Stellaceae bacterium]